MRTHFAEVLARESTWLAGVTDGAELTGWRRQLVTELMTPQSPYALALLQTGDVADRADFLGRWCGLIAETVDRLRSSTSADTSGSAAPSCRGDVDAQRTAVLILAALHGGVTLSRVTQDPRPLDAALDIALAPFTPQRDAASNNTDSYLPDQ